MPAPLKKKYDKLRQHIKKQRYLFINQGLCSQSFGFSSSHAWMWELDHKDKESWAPKNWCFWTVVLEKTLERPSDCKEIQPVHSEGDQSWVFFGRNDAKAETPVVSGQREELRPWQRSWGRRLGILKSVIKPQETPSSRASTPKPESVLCSHLHLWLYRGLSPITVSLGEGVNVQLQDNKNSWAWQECFSLRTPLKVI